MSRRAIVRGGGALLFVLSFASCEAVVGFDGSTYETVIDPMCSCPEMTQAFASASACQHFVEAGLNRGTASQDAAWLTAFHEKQCDLCTVTDIGPKLPCLDAAPVCQAAGLACNDPAECCGYSARASACKRDTPTSAGICTACTKLGDPCKTSDECCGNHTGSYDLPYCSSMTHTCVQRAPSCIKSGEPCSTDAECCGVEGGSASCLPTTTMTVCIERCNPDAPDNCPGCCAAQDALGHGECRDRAPASCSSYCDPTAPNTCPSGLSCKQACFALNCTYVCAA